MGHLNALDANIAKDANHKEKIIEAADDLLLSELLDLQCTSDLTIRFLCGLNSVLEQEKNRLPEKYGSTIGRVRRIKRLIPSQRRSEAFGRRNGVEHEPGYRGRVVAHKREAKDE